MLVLQNVHKTYTLGETCVRALQGLDLRIDEPGFFAVMGRSGSGKSTLLHLAAGLDRPDQGSVIVGGEDLGKLNESKLTLFRRNRIGIVFQKFNLISTMTAFQNAALPAVIDGRPRDWIEHRVNELFKELQIDGRAKHRPDAMSGGEQQRVAIARAMLFSPAIIFADEPTGNLDSTSSERLWRLLSRIATERQMSVVMVTHEPAAAVHCRCVYVIADGKTCGQFEVDGLDASDVASRYQQLGG